MIALLIVLAVFCVLVAVSRPELYRLPADGESGLLAFNGLVLLRHRRASPRTEGFRIDYAGRRLAVSTSKRVVSVAVCPKAKPELKFPEIDLAVPEREQLDWVLRGRPPI